MSKTRINGTATTIPTNKKHHYMATTLVTYFRTEQVPEDGDSIKEVKIQKQKHMNAILHSNKKLINYEMIKQGQVAVMQRCHDELGVKAEEILDFTYMNIVYCGLMTEAEFQGK